MNDQLIALKAKIIVEGELELKLTGRCMEPLLIAGDYGKVIPLSNVEKGRIYLIGLPHGGIVVHRVVEITENVAICKGDRTGKVEIIPFDHFVGLLSEVRLCGKETWYVYQDNALIRKAIILLSSRVTRDKSKGQNVPFSKIKRKASLGMMIVFYSVRRFIWKLQVGRRFD